MSEKPDTLLIPDGGTEDGGIEQEQEATFRNEDEFLVGAEILQNLRLKDEERAELECEFVTTRDGEKCGLSASRLVVYTHVYYDHPRNITACHGCSAQFIELIEESTGDPREMVP